MYSNYSNNGVCHFENFPECLNNPTEMELGSAGGVQWFMKLSKMPNDTHFAPMIYFKYHTENFQVRVAIRYYVWNYHGGYEEMSKKEMMNRTDRCTGSPIKIFNDQVPRTESIEYGIHVESIKSENGIWKFNLAERHVDFNKNQDGLTIKIDDPHSNNETLHCPKQLLKFHSSVVSQYISSKPACLSSNTIIMNSSFGSKRLDDCLQIAYGVRPRLSPADCCRLISVAEKLNLQNVIRYIEQEMIQRQYEPKKVTCQCRNLKRYMADFLKRLESFEQFGEIIGQSEYWAIRELRSEIVKMILDKFMETDF